MNDEILTFENSAELRNHMGATNYNIVFSATPEQAITNLATCGILVFHDGLPVLRYCDSDDAHAIGLKMRGNALFRQNLTKNPPTFKECFDLELARAMYLVFTAAKAAVAEQVMEVLGVDPRK